MAPRAAGRSARSRSRSSADGVAISEAGRTVWENPLDRAFLAAARGAVEVEEHRGSFWPAVEHTATWTDQRVATVAATGTEVRLAGTLSGDAGEVRLDRDRRGPARAAAPRWWRRSPMPTRWP